MHAHFAICSMIAVAVVVLIAAEVTPHREREQMTARRHMTEAAITADSTFNYNSLLWLCIITTFIYTHYKPTALDI